MQLGSDCHDVSIDRRDLELMIVKVARSRLFISLGVNGLGDGFGIELLSDLCHALKSERRVVNIAAFVETYGYTVSLSVSSQFHI